MSCNIQLDTHPEHVVANPENAIVMKPWKGEPGDKGLVELIPFLECEVPWLPSISRLTGNWQPLVSTNLRTSVRFSRRTRVRTFRSSMPRRRPRISANSSRSGKHEEAERYSRARLTSNMPLTRYQGLSSGGFTVSSLFSGNTEKVSHPGPCPPIIQLF
jgi:hypothetical protein